MTDRQPPQDIPAEQAVLGAMLLSKHAVADVADTLTAADFYDPRHEAIFAAILDLYAHGRPADAVTLAAELTRRGDLGRIGGAPYLHTLTASVPAAANAGYYAIPVREHAVRRRLIEAGTRIAQMGYDIDDGADLALIVDLAQAETHALSARPGSDGEPAPIDDFALMLEEIENGRAAGLPTGFADLDQLTGGLHPGQMIIIAARPAIGKSTLGADICRHVSIAKKLPSAFFSLEMPRRELIRRITSAEGRIELGHLAPGCMRPGDWDRANAVAPRIAEAPLIIDDSPDLTVMRLRTKARRLREQRDIRLIVVDYLQLMTAGTGRRTENRQQEVSEMSRAIKLLAKELEIPIIAIAQLNRGPEQRSDKRPVLSDLRESGSLEQDADVVILLHREDATGKTARPGEKAARTGEADFIVAKHRNGATATITVAFQGRFSRFVDLAKPADWSPTSVLRAA